MVCKFSLVINDMFFLCVQVLSIQSVNSYYIKKKLQNETRKDIPLAQYWQIIEKKSFLVTSA